MVVLGSRAANPVLPGPAGPTLTVPGIPPTVDGPARPGPARPGPARPDPTVAGPPTRLAAYRVRSTRSARASRTAAFSLLRVAPQPPQLRQRSFPAAATVDFTVHRLHGTAAPLLAPARLDRTRSGPQPSPP